MNQMQRWTCLVATLLVACVSAVAQVAAGPDAMVRSVSNELLESIKSDRQFQAGDLPRLQHLVDRQVMPHVDMEHLTSLAMGRFWRQASSAQQERLEAEFKALLVRSYAGALSQVSARQTIELKPMRGAPDESEVVVATLIKGVGEPIPIDYRLRRVDADWKIYDVGIAGVWLAANYRNSFAQEVAASGIDGLIEKLHARNQGFAAATTAK